MKILTTLTVSGGLNMASAAKDTFTIGTPLEHNDGQVDNLNVYANAFFKNNVELGSSSVDTINVSGQLTASSGISASFFIGDGSGLTNIQNGGGSNLNVQSSGSGQNIVADYNNGTLTFRSLVAGNNIYFNGNGGEIQINANGGGGGGGINVQTTGSGQNIVANYESGTLTFRSLVAGDNIYFNSNGSEIQINASTGGGGQQNSSLNVEGTGSGVGVFASHQSGTLTLRSIKAGSGISVEEQNGDILVSTNSTLTASAFSGSSILLGGNEINSAWQSYDVQWTTDLGTQPSIGNGSLTGYYKRIGKTVFLRVRLSAGSTTTFGDNNRLWIFSLPVTASSQHGVQFSCSILDSGAGSSPMGTWYNAIGNGSYFTVATSVAIIATSANGTTAAVTKNHPFTWASGDSLQFNGSYEIA